jgi:hypothetical protein
MRRVSFIVVPDIQLMSELVSADRDGVERRKSNRRGRGPVQEAHAFATRLFILGGIDVHHTSSGSFEER